ncbi:aminoacyl-histidine dipeptidase [Anaeromicrobium sediminis]|uniref:Cytosol non-specific dipeptidase n=1 Tax=Anaeromicrobium sediminis TaxID=1478221 RepID=A0A267M9W2_9FIRM|nr:aminoacyl-histidine dipeptidase [Anaeromicrobium sediminis]PAB56364.1 aminoacyl-histidine dipeptidase [Anaeromicrobium sediminis]
MESVLNGIKPGAIFKHFLKLTEIPRCSGNEKKVSDFLVKFAKDHGLEVIQDKALNVIIKKPATKGYENAPTVILQAHMDMVCAKNENFQFDFNKDAIPLIVEEDIIRTKGTTLGADNGIGIAMIMAILESDQLPHPPLVAIFTTGEETEMEGASKLNPEHISGDIMINLDSEEEGILTVSSAGGVNNIVSLPIVWNNAHNTKEAHRIVIKELIGGHSGIEIDKSRASAIKLLGRLLQGIDEKIDLNIASVSGGEKINAIPRMADAIIMIKKEDKKELENIIKEYEGIFHNEFKASDPNIRIYLEKINMPEKVFDPTTKSAVISILRLIPFGVQTMSANMEGLVESSNNIGVLTTKEDEITFESAVRSSVKSLKDEINGRIQIIADLNGAKMELKGDYPEWEFKEDSPIRELMSQVYKEMYNEDIKVKAIHAGLETGVLREKLGDIDIVSIGPNIYNAHTPDEYLSISSTVRTIGFLTEVLRRIK